MIEVRYYYSACVGLRTPDASVLCDPWFTEGAYDGAWYQFPRLEKPLETIPRHDAVYISHIHPDHYDPTFLRAYRSRHPGVRFWIGAPAAGANILEAKMRRDGFSPEVVTRIRVGDSEWCILPNRVGPTPVDSALLVKHRGHVVANLNDNPFDAEQLTEIREFVGDDELRIALLPFTGAGPYPQTYYRDPDTLREKASAKKLDFFDRYDALRRALSAGVNIPFAGQYILGGRLSELNAFRGVADAVEILVRDPRAIVLADGGHATIDSESLVASDARTECHPNAAMQRAIDAIATRPLDAERYFGALPVDAIPFERLLLAAYESALRRNLCDTTYYFSIRVGDRYFVFDTNRKRAWCEWRDEPFREEPRSEIEIDPRYLYGLLTGVFHWNNAEVGSQFRVHRVPDHYNERAQAVLNFLRV